MKCLGGGIAVNSEFYRKVRYDISNSGLTAGFDGCGNLLHYSPAGEESILSPGSFYSGFTVDDIKISAADTKTVEMRGRRQKITLESGKVILEQFADQNNNCLVYRFSLSGDVKKFSWDFGYSLTGDNQFLYIKLTSGELELREVEGRGCHYSFRSSGGKRVFSIIFSSENIVRSSEDLYKSAMEYEEELCSYIETEDEFLKTLFVSSLNTGISAYKQIGSFKGFFAGIHYHLPARTYYRDSYYTVLPLMKIRQSWVRSQILTLAGGIDADFDCPSGVQADGGAWWPKHIDSPLYFVWLVDDYISSTGDNELLDETVNTLSVLECMVKITGRLLDQCDDTGLLPREEWNRHDWVDNIYRCGYVTYIQVLLYRALNVMKRLNPDNLEAYRTASDKLYSSFNSILWDEKLNYYINYVITGEAEYREDNLSIDTVLALKYGLVPESRREIFLNSLESLLETRNNSEQPFGDWGTMCVYPPYRYAEHLVEKSMYDYVYHNGSDWPYLSSVYSLVKKEAKRDYLYPLTKWFSYGLEKGWYTPVEYYNPLTGRGSLLQGWSAVAAEVFISGGRDERYRIKI